MKVKVGTTIDDASSETDQSAHTRDPIREPR